MRRDALALLIIVFLLPIQICHAASEEFSDCSTPPHPSALAVSHAIHSVCILAKQAVPDGVVGVVGGYESENYVATINQTIQKIGERLTQPNPFGSCWWDSRFDCLKVKQAVDHLGELVKGSPVTESPQVEILTPMYSAKIKAVDARDDLIQQLHSFCNTLRH